MKLSSVDRPKVSIVIRCKNESAHIEECLRMLYSQIVDFLFELIIIDSGSNDSTVEICKRYDLTIYKIDSKDFSFGSSINLGIELSRGEYCVFLSGHAIPVDVHWLSELIQPFEENDKIVGVYSRQTYKNDTFFVERRTLDKTFGLEKQLQRLINSKCGFRDVLENIKFSNASSCIRKSVVDEFPFADICASEDREWAYRVLREGYIIQYNPKSCVIHAHNEDPDKYYKRILINSKAVYEFLGVSIKFYHVIPLFVARFVSDIKYCRLNGIKLSKQIVKDSLVYNYRYVKAHYLATRE